MELLIHNSRFKIRKSTNDSYFEFELWILGLEFGAWSLGLGIWGLELGTLIFSLNGFYLKRRNIDTES